ncbi:transposase (plasmid) [Azospirillum sp. B510]|nr:transposase [Azospirillum sp. B510]
MTTDLVVDVIVGGRLVTLARAIKPAAELSKPRILEKLEIERRYWLAQNVEWGVLTERDVPMIPEPETSDSPGLWLAVQRR